MKIGHKLKELREKMQWSLDTLAEKSGFSKSYLSKLENDLSTPSLQAISKLANIFDGAINIFFEDVLKTNDVEFNRHNDDWTDGIEYRKKLIIKNPIRLRAPYLIYIIEINYSTEQPEMRKHEGIESLYLESGSVEVTIKDSFGGLNICQSMQVGDIITYPGKAYHTFWNKDPDKVARGILVSSDLDLLYAEPDDETIIDK